MYDVIWAFVDKCLWKDGELLIIEEVNSILATFDFITSAVAILFSLLHKPSVANDHSVVTNGEANKKDISARMFRVAKMIQIILCACFFIWLVCFLAIQLDGIMLFPYGISLYLFYGAVVFRCFYCSNDHDMSSGEMDAFLLGFILRRQSIQKFTASFTFTTESIYHELLSLFFLSVNWLVIIFSFIVMVNLLLNTLCKRFTPNALNVPQRKEDLMWNVGNWMVEKCRRRPVYYFLLPILFFIDLVKNILISAPYLFVLNAKAYIVCAYNSVFVYLCQCQKSKKDTEIIRFDFKLSLVLVLTLIYMVIVLQKTHSSEAIDIYSFIATALVLPVLLDGLIGLRKRKE